MTLDNKRVQVARPTVENSLAQGIVGMELPAIDGGISGQYYLIPENANDLDTVEGLMFSEADLELQP